MWEITNPTIQKTKLDFTSSGQGFREVSRLVSDGVEIINALELTDFDEDKTQVLICDHCGTIHCKSGDWIVLRKSVNFVLMIPAFDEMQDEWSTTEYAPPKYFGKEGTPYFSFETYLSLQKLNSVFPSIENIKPLQMSEAMRLAQFSMPMNLFGKPLEVKLKFEKAKNIVASSEGEPKDFIRIIENILIQNYDNQAPANLRRVKEDENVIYLFIDDFEFMDWKVLVKNQSEYKLIIEETFVAEITENNERDKY